MPSTDRSVSRWLALGGAVSLVAIVAAVGFLQSPRAAGSPSSAVSEKKPKKPALHVAPSGSDGGPCSEADPCASFNRAFQVARPGQTVIVAGGTYPSQTVEADPKKTSAADVLFRAAKRADVRIDGELVVSASHVAFRRMKAQAWQSVNGDDQTFRNMDVDVLHIKGSSHVSVIGGDVGPLQDHDSQVTSFEGRVPTEILFDRVYFHDATKTDPKSHTECLQFGSGVAVVVRQSRFRRCADHDIFISSWGNANGTAHPLKGFLIENNFFDRTIDGYYALRLAGDSLPCQDFVIRNNSSLQNLYSDCDTRNVQFLANIQPEKTAFSCTKSYGSVWDWNVYGSGEPCGPHDIVARADFQNPSSFDLHLKPGAPAIGHGAPSSTPGNDIDGDKRPMGAPDAGADER